ncbi:hypothetical protein [Halalkalicoccus jeotgali]|uniref:Uncharacterized protein n=1 Tax=Halalkalicoccus jeotgali (strain DSM 18796 / CECT 7217 / JCM 14584 / KCTC 4019 / B3) TaxID=795797 RepID=D8J4U2_HALJB|nr:hypothetical protein [Halalkalicoccus jeotgali]ADJ15559.1 hypothetical protein HacjB3_10880 [Halalkalicoccus jeotgali B3]ELY36032.1 hypothetical protein C497_11787 [Halalkalicoccus jeotgali B3]
MADVEKTKAVAVCDGCGELAPVRVWPDGTIHPIGSEDGCCEEADYRILEDGESAAAFE